MFGDHHHHRQEDDDWKPQETTDWDHWLPDEVEGSAFAMDVVGVALLVAGAVLVCALLACCCRRRSTRGAVLSPPPLPAAPPAPPSAAPYPRQQYNTATVAVPMVTPYAPQPTAYPPAVGLHPQPQPLAAGYPHPPAVGAHPTAPSAPDVYDLPPPYEQAVRAMGPLAPSSPYNPDYKH